MTPTALILALTIVALPPDPPTGPDAPESAPQSLYVHCLTCPAVSVDGLAPQFLAESVPIIKCESTHREAAVNATSGTRGLLQIHPIHIRRIERLGYTWDDMLTAGPNLHVAATIHAESSWRPWSCRHTPVPVVGNDFGLLEVQ